MQLIETYVSKSRKSIWVPYLNSAYSSWIEGKNYLDDLVTTEDWSIGNFNTWVLEARVHKPSRKEWKEIVDSLA
ncbi:hypothetical protein VCO139_0079 [Vibrio phage VCO139]|uniref:Uncharacterized protein n=2 Tax=Pacinivirus VCO139 TaxID=2846607 RepID=R9R4C8_9CAUD|nr:hypothetical protein M612_gp26 [Vibrio phage JA-1]YP_009874380.1 hypothetical protein HYO77_gp25 [Vibrio phage VCO139]AGI61829.1 hypothetical protein JA1_0077 [Vibrio phage JA-1]AGI61905.1 hypothetical protein VCO139_0079 [Vibrio phage VCO139]